MNQTQLFCLDFQDPANISLKLSMFCECTAPLISFSLRLGSTVESSVSGISNDKAIPLLRYITKINEKKKSALNPGPEH